MSSMDSPPFAGSTFIIRVWLERSATGSCWRGQIVHVQSGEKRYFLSLEDMLKFIRDFVSMPEVEGKA
jgi:hypothetical protein